MASKQHVLLTYRVSEGVAAMHGHHELYRNASVGGVGIWSSGREGVFGGFWAGIWGYGGWTWGGVLTKNKGGTWGIDSTKINTC